MNDLRERVWNELIEIGARPPMITDKRLAKAKEYLADDEDFWWDMLDRHGMREMKIPEMDEHHKDHLIGNFWGQICEALYRIKKGIQ